MPIQIEYDAVVIGAGPTGCLVAEKLASQGMSVPFCQLVD